ncbi:MAG TPA: DUF2784 domain-containing protein [Gemmatimonadales bacterium]|nr:DUF2784 domain-containing protein [Gemmatimonadales bacterium]
MLYRLGADLLVLLHLAFVVFVALGGLLILRWRRAAWIHVPAALWGVMSEWAGIICPLTPLENSLRERGGQAGYAGGFIDHYLLPALYPPGLTPRIQFVLGLGALVVNLLIYGWIFGHRRSTHDQPS